MRSQGWWLAREFFIQEYLYHLVTKKPQREKVSVPLCGSSFVVQGWFSQTRSDKFGEAWTFFDPTLMTICLDCIAKLPGGTSSN
jgi:hypothetical protein